MENQKERQEFNTLYWDRVAQEVIKPYSEGLGEVVIHPKIQERIEECLRNYHPKNPSR